MHEDMVENTAYAIVGFFVGKSVLYGFADGDS